jgi:hypothetical protein
MRGLASERVRNAYRHQLTRCLTVTQPPEVLAPAVCLIGGGSAAGMPFASADGGELVIAVDCHWFGGSACG